MKLKPLKLTGYEKDIELEKQRERPHPRPNTSNMDYECYDEKSFKEFHNVIWICIKI